MEYYDSYVVESCHELMEVNVIKSSSWYSDDLDVLPISCVITLPSRITCLMLTLMQLRFTLC